jgi:hypothetical protein
MAAFVTHRQDKVPHFRLLYAEKRGNLGTLARI